MSSPITCNKNVKALSGVPREKKCKTFKFLNKEQYLTSNASCSRKIKPKNLGTPKINIYITYCYNTNCYIYQYQFTHAQKPKF